jgi:hypothetical protein
MKGKTVVSATTGDVIPGPYRSSPRHPLYLASSGFVTYREKWIMEKRGPRAEISNEEVISQS